MPSADEHKQSLAQLISHSGTRLNNLSTIGKSLQDTTRALDWSMVVTHAARNEKTLIKLKRM